jgi:mono/diheme cytochrome c family protein
VVVTAVMVAAVVLGRLPFTPYPSGQAVVEISMEHVSGQPAKETARATGAAGEVEHEEVEAEEGPAAPTRLTLEVDGSTVLDRIYPHGSDGAAAQVYEQINLPPGSHHLRLTMYDRAGQRKPRVLADESVTLDAGQVLPLHFRDQRAGGDPAAGRRLYFQPPLGTHTSCRACHSLEPGVTLVGPSFAGIAASAAARVPGMSAEAYLYQSIVDPDAQVVEGFKQGQMVRDSAQRLTEEQIRDLVAFLMTLK